MLYTISGFFPCKLCLWNEVLFYIHGYTPLKSIYQAIYLRNRKKIEFDQIKNRLHRKNTCFHNQPLKQFPSATLPPGYTVDRDKQCKLAYGAEFRACSALRVSEYF